MQTFPSVIKALKSPLLLTSVEEDLTEISLSHNLHFSSSASCRIYISAKEPSFWSVPTRFSTEISKASGGPEDDQSLLYSWAIKSRAPPPRCEVLRKREEFQISTVRWWFLSIQGSCFFAIAFSPGPSKIPQPCGVVLTMAFFYRPRMSRTIKNQIVVGTWSVHISWFQKIGLLWMYVNIGLTILFILWLF